MNNTKFTEIIENQIQKCKDLLIKKGEEYATEDRLHNFRSASVLENSTLKAACAGFMAKHTISIYDMCNSDKDFALEQWDEKITDHINYLLLLSAIVKEEKGEK